VALFFFAVRSSEGLVWNDSPQTAENLYGFQPAGFPQPAQHPASRVVCRDEGAFGLRLGNPGLAATIVERAFSCLEFGGYRPLSAALSFTGVAVFSEGLAGAKPYLGQLWTAGVGCLFGLLAVLLFLVSRAYLRTDYAAYAVVVLFFFSPAVVSGAWIMFSGGIQVTVPLFICLGLWLHRKTSEAKERRGPWTIALGIALLAGPWVREYIGIVAALIMWLELQQHRRITGIFLLALAGFAHALFPTALVHPLVPQLPLIPVFKLGSLAAQLGAAAAEPSLANLLGRVKWEAASVFLVLLPPSLFVLAALFLVLSLPRDWRSLAMVVALGALAVLAKGKPWFSATLILAYCALAAYAARYAPGEPDPRASLRRAVFVTVWFLASLLPFFKVLSAHVHLAYPLIPGLILVVAASERFLLHGLKASSRVPWNKAAVAAALVLCFTDQLLNAYGSYVTTTSLYGAIRSVADWMRSHTPRGTIVIANAVHAEDIRLYSDNHISPYWSVGVGVPPERTLEKPAEMERFLRQHLASGNVLMLNMEQPFTEIKGNYHAHKYITRRSVPLGAPVKVHAMAARFPFADPLRHLLPRELALFLGPPDLENDIYFGRERSRRRFLHEVTVTYYVQPVLDATVSKAAYFMPDSTFLYPRYLEVYRGYLLCGYRDRFLAVPEGTTLDERTLSRSDPRFVAGSSIDELKATLDAQR
jgi:hypothetical protein